MFASPQNYAAALCWRLLEQSVRHKSGKGSLSRVLLHSVPQIGQRLLVFVLGEQGLAEVRAG